MHETTTAAANHRGRQQPLFENPFYSTYTAAGSSSPSATEYPVRVRNIIGGSLSFGGSGEDDFYERLAIHLMPCFPGRNIHKAAINILMQHTGYERLVRQTAVLAIRQMLLPTVCCVLGGAFLLKADSVVKTIGAIIC